MEVHSKTPEYRIWWIFHLFTHAHIVFEYQKKSITQQKERVAFTKDVKGYTMCGE